MKSAWLPITLLSALVFACSNSLVAQEADQPAKKGVEETAPSRSDRRNRVSVHHSSHEDVVVVGSDVVIKEGESKHDIVLVGGSLTVDGNVTSDIVVILGSVKLGATAKVRKDVVVVAGTLDADPQAEIGGDRVVIGAGVNIPTWLKWPQDWFNKGLLLARPFPHQFLWSWALAGLFLLIYLLIAVIFPQSVQASIQVLEKRPGSSFLAGLLAFLLFGVLSFFLAVTVVGVLLIPFLICGVIAAFLFGKVTVYRYAGQQLGEQIGIVLLQKPVIGLLVGAIIFFLLYTIPILGFIVWGAVTPLGIGAVLLAFFKRFRAESVNGTQGEPVAVMAVPPLVSPEQPGASQPSPMVLPRVGFWQRFAATLIDAVLIGVLMAFTRARPPAFIFIWTAYHIAMWTWKGTTIGGMVFGLKIIRTDGRAINFPVALVRALSAFLSATAAFIGFFWAGWSAEKQSWHDKIAGTYVVKLPKGVSVF